MIYLSRFSEALEYLDRSIHLDPASAATSINLARSFYAMGLHESAISHLDDAIELEPSNYIGIALKAAVLIELGTYSEALVLCKESLTIQDNLDTLARIGVLYALMDQAKDAHEIIQQIKSKAEGNSKNSIKLARIYMALGHETEVFDYLERAFDEHEIDLVTLKFDPAWKSIREKSRFMALMRRVGIT